jgi:hypothetical protein
MTAQIGTFGRAADPAFPDSTSDLFTESWEALLPRVVESLAITSTLCANGSGALDVSSAAYCQAS